MSAALIAQLIIALGPPALQMIKELAQIWSKDTLTVDEVVAFCDRSKKSYDDYIAEAKAANVSTGSTI